jgi:hypothetical protein
MEDSKMSISGIGQNYYHNNVATVRNTKNVNSTGKNDGFAGKVTEKNPVSPEDMTLEEYKAISPVFEEDIYDAISMETCVKKRNTIGAPGQEAMKKVIALNEAYLAE